MTCNAVQERLNAFLDQELPRDQARVIDAHVAGCAACAALMEEYAAVRSIASAWEAEAAPEIDALQAIWTEVQALREEVASLRQELAVLRAERPSPLLRPYAARTVLTRVV